MRRLAAAASAAAALICVSAIPAQAEQAPPFTPGMVLAHHRGVIRSGPSTAFTISGHVRDGQIVPLLCETTGQSVRGHRLWYKLNDRPAMWVSSVLVGRMGKAPSWCAYHGLPALSHRPHAKKKRKLHGVVKGTHRLLTHQVPQNTMNLRLNQQGLQKLQRELMKQRNQQVNQQLNQQELQKLQHELMNQQDLQKQQIVSGRPAQVVGKD